MGVIIPNAVLTCRDSTTLAEITVLSFIQEVEVLAFLLSCTCHEVVEDVEVTLSGWYGRYAVALEIIVEGLDTGEAATVSELQLCVFTEARSIRVEQSAGVTKGLDNKLCGGQLGSEFGAFLSWIRNGKFKNGLYGESAVL
jgi:hypothetical protein